MKFLPLYDLQHEINRLFIAGSKFAKNDPRLLKQAAVFNQLGEKSPVFKKIAEGIEALINAESVDSSIKLLDLSTLLYAVLYTQGETVDAEQPKTELSPVLLLNDVYTKTSYLAIKPVIEVLTLQKGGRMYNIKAAFENKRFNDFRIYHLFDAALADSHTEFADYIETVIIPAIGKPIIPFIINNFNYEGKMDDVRRFRILHKLHYHGISGMIDEILAGKSVLLQVEAVKTLNNAELLIKFAGDRQKAIRLAAYNTLANLNTETAQRTLVELFVSGKKKSDMSELSETLKINLLDTFIPALLEKAKADYKKYLELNKSAEIKTVVGAFENLKMSINPLINNINEDVLNFFKDVFANKKYHELSKIIESKNNYFYLSGQLVNNVAKSLENTKKGLGCLKFLTENSPYDEFLYSCFKASLKHIGDKKIIYNYFVKYTNKLLKSNLFDEIFPDKDKILNTNDYWKQFMT
jgi:hypothetical protein